MNGLRPEPLVSVMLKILSLCGLLLKALGIFPRAGQMGDFPSCNLKVRVGQMGAASYSVAENCGINRKGGQALQLGQGKCRFWKLPFWKMLLGRCGFGKHSYQQKLCQYQLNCCFHQHPPFSASIAGPLSFSSLSTICKKKASIYLNL